MYNKISFVKKLSFTLFKKKKKHDRYRILMFGTGSFIFYDAFMRRQTTHIAIRCFDVVKIPMTHFYLLHFINTIFCCWFFCSQ